MTVQEVIIALIPAVVLGLFGSLLMRSHSRSWQSQQDDGDLEELDLNHLRSRYRRRMQASCLLIVIGVMISVGQFVITKDTPVLFGVYWIAVLLLTFWVILLALGDVMSIAAYSRIAQSRINVQREQIQQELNRFRAQQGNGHSSTEERESTQE